MNYRARILRYSTNTGRKNNFNRLYREAHIESIGKRSPTIDSSAIYFVAGLPKSHGEKCARGTRAYTRDVHFRLNRPAATRYNAIHGARRLDSRTQSSWKRRGANARAPVLHMFSRERGRGDHYSFQDCEQWRVPLSYYRAHSARAHARASCEHNHTREVVNALKASRL